MKVALIPTGRSDWQAEGRVLGRAELPLSAGAENEIDAWAPPLAELGMRRILHGPDELSRQTALILARRLRATAKSVEDLQEADMGVWTGLTDEQLETRYATAYRELCDAPLNVSPPTGESLAGAADRIDGCIRKLLKRTRHPIGVVLRPVAFSLARRALEGADAPLCGSTSGAAATPRVIDPDQPADPKLEGVQHG